MSDSPAHRIRRSVQALQPYVPGEQPRGKSLVKLNTNENPYPPSPLVARALEKMAGEPETLRLYPDPLCRGLREKLASYHACDPGQILVGNGSDEVLALCLRAFVERGGSAGFFDPSYSLYPVLAAIEDVVAKPVSLTPDFAWAMPEGYHADLFFLTNPNAPTSTAFPKDRIRSFCEEASGVVVIDEAYADFADEDCMDLARGMDNVLVARTLSKSFSLAGLRLGYVVGPSPLVAALYKIKDSYNVDGLAQRLAGAALDDVEHMRANRARIVATRERVGAALREQGFAVAASQTNFLWIQPPGGDAAGLFETLRERGILVRYFPGPVTGGYLRVTVGTDADMDAFLAALKG
jgi:histidinol-phosphate aminotransferase